ncbi:hypothetical protein FGO68_gene8506 [Halteria grandinella]|uniref:Transmembrane protein n=1 Tax=Halteria grandinella TaxID=5974 RepID=A0A8J8NF49_HALGN|nr:hypothetical protein FGO68_gene8506 [Halteria grandinella]
MVSVKLNEIKNISLSIIFLISYLLVQISFCYATTFSEYLIQLIVQYVLSISKSMDYYFQNICLTIYLSYSNQNFDVNERYYLNLSKFAYNRSYFNFLQFITSVKYNAILEFFLILETTLNKRVNKKKLYFLKQALMIATMKQQHSHEQSEKISIYRTMETKTFQESKLDDCVYSLINFKAAKNMVPETIQPDRTSQEFNFLVIQGSWFMAKN